MKTLRKLMKDRKPEFMPHIEDPDLPDWWTEEDYAEMRRRLREHWGSDNILRDSGPWMGFDGRGFDENLHPRGQPDNPGQFGPGASSTGASSSPKGTKTVKEGKPPKSPVKEVQPAAHSATKALSTSKTFGKNPQAALSRSASERAAAKASASKSQSSGSDEPTQKKVEGDPHPEVQEGRAPKANAASLYTPSTKDAAGIAAAVPGGTEAVAKTSARLKEFVVTDALPEKGGYKNANGTYTPERAAIHEKIVQEYINPETVAKYTPKPGESPLLTILGGRGGSGKSWLTSKDGPIDTERSLVLDADEIKSKLPGYEGWNAALYHEESSDIVAQIDARAAKIGMNVVLDGTLKSENIQKRIDVYQAPPSHEYEMEGYYMYASPETAATRAMGRFATKKGDFSGRFVPPEVILGNVNNEKNFDKMSEGFRKWGVYDNDADKRGEAPRLVSQGERKGKRVL